MIDTHTHLDGEEFREDLPEVISRAREAGITQVFVPAIDLKSCDTVLSLCRQYPDYARPMLGLHPEEVRSDWREVLSAIKEKISSCPLPLAPCPSDILAIGEVGLDYYWSREYEREQIEAFEEQVRWSVEMRLPLTIASRATSGKPSSSSSSTASSSASAASSPSRSPTYPRYSLRSYPSAASSSRPTAPTWLPCPIAASATSQPTSSR